MTSPYDIEEIFPGDATDPVRLPRRQTGNSPQGLAVTLLADYTLRTRAWSKKFMARHRNAPTR